jgi:hypothetical protein
MEGLARQFHDRVKARFRRANSVTLFSQIWFPAFLEKFLHRKMFAPIEVDRRRLFFASTLAAANRQWST